MYDFTKVAAPIKITTEYILSRIDQTVIWIYYYGHFKLHTAYHSKFRRDSKPSTIFYINQKGNITLKDFASSERLDCFTFIMKLYNCSFKDALNRVAIDFGLTSKISVVPKEVFKQAEILDTSAKAETKIQFIPDKWTDKNSLFWQFGEISKEELEKEDDIFVVKTLYVNEREIYNPLGYTRYAYLINYLHDGEMKQGVKIYSPEDPKMKWLSSVPLSAVGWLDKLPFKDDKVFVVKSRKDAQILKKFFTDIVYVQNESEAAFPEEIRQYLLSKYKRVIVLFGADPQAVNVCKTITEGRMEYFNTLKEDYEKYAAEDPFDTVKLFGIDYFEKQLKVKNLL